VRSHFARHTERLLIRTKICGGFGTRIGSRSTTKSLDPEDYSGTGKTAVRYLRDLEKDGGYVWVESRDSPGVAKVGRVKPGTPVELEDAL
jgi:hypothetical protein